MSVTGADPLPSLASHLSISPLEECDAATPTVCETVDGEGETLGMSQTTSEVMACKVSSSFVHKVLMKLGKPIVPNMCHMTTDHTH